MRTSNPALNQNVFQRARSLSSTDTRMTISGTVNKTFVLLLLCAITASYSWQASLKSMTWTEGATFAPSPLLWIGAIGGFIVALVTIFKQEWAGITAPLYAALEGLFLGAVSAGFEVAFPGIALQAVMATFGTLFALLAIYRTGLIRVTQNFRMGVAAATGGILLVYLVQIVMGFFGKSIPAINQSGTIGIGFSVVVVAIAALNLVLDFDFIEQGEQAGAPKFMEWYGAFGLMVTLVWLYLEILNLLAKLRGRD